ncbi:uncharacterized protein LOC105698945 [Orussus abietinus]|uniref:uncharacterized protein LOC105698945 n=1 Tax=Orussus abietinus TaxID=222816 RepID=UPI0006250DBC|nr:uncharacterized protein LOC105698945 [Orussus abietinus]
MNNSIHKATGETPSKLLFGVDQRGRIDDNIKEFLKREVNRSEQNLDSLREKTCKRLEKAQAYNKGYANKRHKSTHKFLVGDYVIIRNFDSTPGTSPKLRPKFKGPYVVARELRNNRFVVSDIPGFQLTQRRYEGVWEPTNMRPWSATIQKPSD